MSTSKNDYLFVPGVGFAVVPRYEDDSPRETVYRGERLFGPLGEFEGTSVTVDGRPLGLRASLRVRRLSPCGFEWGYSGAGAAQLALALLLDVTGDPLAAVRAMHWFKWAVCHSWGRRWTITAGEIRRWLDQHARECPIRLADGSEREPSPAVVVEGGAA